MPDCGLHNGEKPALSQPLGTKPVENSVETVESPASDVYAKFRALTRSGDGLSLIQAKARPGGSTCGRQYVHNYTCKLPELRYCPNAGVEL